MNETNKNLSIRWVYMTVGVIAMLFAGVLYAWSILKSPLAMEFGWGQSELALNFTLAMTFFCIGGLLGAQISRRLGHRIALICARIILKKPNTSYVFPKADAKKLNFYIIKLFPRIY